jgi:YihY family inner membrane protein
VSIGSALLTFLLLYVVLPNKRQSVRQALPGSLVAAVLFFLLLQVFPLYTAIFGRGFVAYAAFGVFLLLMFWTYLLGLVLVLGAELNAFLEVPHGRPQQPVSGEGITNRGRSPTPVRGG